MSPPRDDRRYPPGSRDREKSLTEEVQDTPPGGFRQGPAGDVDRLVYKYNAGESIPPPPEEVQQKTNLARQRMRDVSQSGSWVLETALDGLKIHYEKSIYEMQLTHERERREDLEKKLAEERKRREDAADWWKDLAKHTIAPVLSVGIILTIGAIVAAVVYFKVHAGVP